MSREQCGLKDLTREKNQMLIHKQKRCSNNDNARKEEKRVKEKEIVKVKEGYVSRSFHFDVKLKGKV